MRYDWGDVFLHAILVTPAALLVAVPIYVYKHHAGAGYPFWAYLGLFVFYYLVVAIPAYYLFAALDQWYVGPRPSKISIAKQQNDLMDAQLRARGRLDYSQGGWNAARYAAYASWDKPHYARGFGEAKAEAEAAAAAAAKAQAAVAPQARNAAVVAGVAAAAGGVAYAAAQTHTTADRGGDYYIALDPVVINPASGLPTTMGMGTPDVMGNSWCTTDHQQYWEPPVDTWQPDNSWQDNSWQDNNSWE